MSNPHEQSDITYIPETGFIVDTDQERTEGEPGMTEGRKDDQEKPRWDLLPWEQVEEVVKVLSGGAVTYDDDNWKRVPEARRRYFAAAHRHLVAWKKGETVDPQYEMPHLAHAVCDLLFLMWLDSNATPAPCDDRR